MRALNVELTAIAAVLVGPLLLPAFTARPAVAAGIVGTGTAATCTDAALNTALDGGGLLTFNCGTAPVTIDISTGTDTKTISADTTIDGGSLITISGGHSVGVFSVNTGVKFTVQNLTIADGNNSASRGGGGISNLGHADGHKQHLLRQQRVQRRRHLQRLGHGRRHQQHLLR
jgi:hypothetical protein